ncbi:winged helix family transcriptional regulator [Paludibacter sp. 221]|uniref:winged helix-turn-helix domain-containing protein n=1 Tax=Paludibacter sp. 221 TaxID=2302939 RepID=UPI0013D6FA20|nr:winged helix-turn-helix domain-containing protein [Paludibacter sp. 221]NDV46134.1 winged helix family transcriptional regulator [Paludibacter sp. 221]
MNQVIFNDAQRIVSVNGTTTRLTEKEFLLLQLLYSNKGEIVERDTSLSSIWKNVDEFTRRSMDVYICKLRKKFKSFFEIESIHSQGHKLIEI